MEMIDFLILRKACSGEGIFMSSPPRELPWVENYHTYIFTLSSIPFIASSMGDNVLFIGQFDTSIMTVFTTGPIS